MKRVKKYVALLLLSIFTLSFVGCGTESDPMTINVYTAIEEEYVSEYLAAFQAKYPDIKVNVIRDSSGVVSAKLLVEKENPRADVVWGVPASNSLLLDEQDVFFPYKSPQLDKIDETFYDGKNEIPHWVGISAWMTAITVNTTELAKVGLPIPKSYKDLLNPAYGKNLIMPNPASSGTGFLTVSAWLQLMGEDGWAYMDELHKNIAEYSHSGSAPTKQTAQGEFLIGVGMDFLSLQLEKDNPNIITVFPEEGSGWEVEVLALVKKAEIKDSAKIFYEWALSDEAMELYSKNRSMITVKGSTSEEVKNQLIENDFNWASENRNRILKTWEEKYGAGE